MIRPDDTVVIRVARSEMGQGTLTGLAQMVAEELECDWSKVTTEYPTPGQSVARKRVWGDFSTGGSRGIRESHEYVRQGGATARMMLVQAAADGWKVPAAECSAANSVITHKPSGRTTTYGKVAEAAAKLTPPANVPLKDPKDWKLIGKPVKRLDTVEKLTGAQVYGMDLKLPGMLNAAIKDCPVFGGKVKSFEAAKVTGMPGVRHVVQVGDSAVAVVADTWWQAKTALDALPIVWDEGQHAKVSSAQIADMLKAGLDADQAFVGNQNGDAKAAIAGAAKKVEAVYAYPFQNHAPMEPMNATARYTAGSLRGLGADAERRGRVRGDAGRLRPSRRQVRGLQDQSRRRVRPARRLPRLRDPGGPDRQADPRHAGEAALVARGGHDARPVSPGHAVQAGRRVRREQQPDRPAHAHLGAVDPGRGAPGGLQNGRDPATFQGLNPSGEFAFGYSVPNLLIDHAMRNTHVPPGFWRGVNINQNAIYVECFMDELAQAAGQDPLEFRRKLMAKHPKHLAVLNAVADRAGWGKPAPQGVYRGLAQMMAFNSYVAACAEISVSGGNKVKVHRIVCATDPGLRRQPGADRAADRRVVRLRAVRAVHGGVHGQGRPHRAGRTSTPTTRCGSRRCRRSSRSSCRPAGSGAASASRRSAWRRPPCSTRTSPPRASASARSR